MTNYDQPPVEQLTHIDQAPVEQVMAEIEPFEEVPGWGYEPSGAGHIEFNGRTHPYFVAKSKQHDPADMSPDSVHVFDIEDGVPEGHGSISLYSPTHGPDRARYPYVGYTMTYKSSQKQGLGTERLKVMDALSRHFFRSPLYSSLDSEGTNPDAARRWEQLVREGLAEEVFVAGRNGWRFKEQPAQTTE